MDVAQWQIRNWLIDQNEFKVTSKYFKVFKSNMSPNVWSFYNGTGYLNVAKHFDAKKTAGNEEVEKLDVKSNNDSLYQMLNLWNSTRGLIYGMQYPTIKKDRTKFNLFYTFEYVNQLVDNKNFQLFPRIADERDFIRRLAELELTTDIDKQDDIDKKADLVVAIASDYLAHLQKWHLFISVFAMKLVCERKIKGDLNENLNWKDPDAFWEQPFDTKMGSEYPPLRLWMVENAEARFGKLQHGPSQIISKKMNSNSTKQATNDLINACFYSIFYGAPLKDDPDLALSCKNIHDEMLKQEGD